VPAPRLLVLADPKLLPALAAGLREGGRFDVVAVSLADPAAAQGAAETVDSVALFYGMAGAALPVAIQALAPKIRQRGGRVVAVLQREQGTQRDECFRFGASDILFMPIPKDQFVDRLAAAVGLAFHSEPGASASVAVSTRSASLRLDAATVSPAGVESASSLPIKAGDTVRLSWGAFQSWGLVVRGAPAVQIRLAGLAPEEEGKIRDWAKTAAPQPAAPARPAPVAQPPAPGARAAPVSGPPPGFGDRKPARPMPRAAPAAVAVAPAAAARPAQARSAVAQPSAGSRPAPRASSAATALSTALFDGEGAAPAVAAPVITPAAPPGPPWPSPVDAEVCKDAAMKLLAGANLDRSIPGPIAASARKISALLSVGERAWIERIGPESHFADALAARIALDAATAEGTRMGSANLVPSVETAALSALTKVADEAAARLQKEANAAIGKGEVESLQLITAASAALSRDLLNLKETADRLRGVGAAPRMGAGHLDPDVAMPGQPARPKAVQQPVQAVEKAELRDFRGLEDKPSRAKGILAAVMLVGCIAAAANAFYFGVPHHTEIPPSAVGDGVRHIDVSGPAALVTVTPEWLADPEPNVAKLIKVLNANQVKKAVLILPNGASAGIVDVAAGRTSGMPQRAGARSDSGNPSPAVQSR
jgi:CheY-like chemotaxis protein